jgi:hypothetical protein
MGNSHLPDFLKVLWPQAIVRSQPKVAMEIDENKSEMATEKQIAADRENAAKSTGAKTAAGKVISSRNSLKFGQRTLALLPGEDEAAFQELAETYHSYWQPV